MVDKKEVVRNGGDQLRVIFDGYPENPNDILDSEYTSFPDFNRLVFEFPDEVFVFRTEYEFRQFLNGFHFFFDKFNS